MNYIIAMLPLVSWMSTHNHLLHFARICAGPTHKTANKNIQQRTLPSYLTQHFHSSKELNNWPGMFHSKPWIRSIIVKAFVPVRITHKYPALNVAKSYWCWMWLSTSRDCDHPEKNNIFILQVHTKYTGMPAISMTSYCLEDPYSNHLWHVVI